jgi:hypothetical protein
LLHSVDKSQLHTLAVELGAHKQQLSSLKSLIRRRRRTRREEQGGRGEARMAGGVGGV